MKAILAISFILILSCSAKEDPPEKIKVMTIDSSYLCLTCNILSKEDHVVAYDTVYQSSKTTNVIVKDFDGNVWVKRRRIGFKMIDSPSQ